MNSQFSRTENLIGTDALQKLAGCHIAVFGIGGVGGYVVEALIRAGVTKIDLIDSDCVDITNLNRQIIALHSTVGKPKVEVMRQRVLDINPNAVVNTFPVLFLPENSHQFNFSKYDYVVDAIDNVTAKIELAVKCQESGTPLISSMGTGNKLDPTKFEVTDIYKTSVCPLAKVMRYELKKRGIKKLKVLYSKEEPIKNSVDPRTPMSISFVPSAAGFIIAGEVIKDIIK
ncbi:MAG: tRNA threonylcarbamoyladenosine dehydratase [Clostridia bacterium]|nr:tRNA threonylcarbamoyladenosine dehydratase [Clostridia bacterium]